MGQTVGSNTAIEPPIVWTENVRRLISCRRCENSRIHIDHFSPRVVRFETEPVHGALDEGNVQGVVAAGALIEPCNAVTNVGIGSCCRRNIQRALWDESPQSRPYDRSARRCASADASLRVLAYERQRRVGIYRDRSVVRLAADITHRKHEIPRNPPLYRQAPLLVRRREQNRIHSSRRIDRTGRRWRRAWSAASGRERRVLLQRKKREHRTCKDLACIKWWIRVSPVPKVVLKVIMDSEAGSHRPAPRPCRLPHQAHTRLQQEFRVVLRDTRMRDDWVGRHHEVSVKHVV